MRKNASPVSRTPTSVFETVEVAQEVGVRPEFRIRESTCLSPDGELNP
jgi:hypothetical protein